MIDLVLYGLLAVVIAGALFLAASRFLPAGEQIAPAVRDEPVWELPAERGLLADDIDAVRLPVALRGYRFAETDQLLDRLAGELRARDEEIARLRGGGVPSGPCAAQPTEQVAEAESPTKPDPAATSADAAAATSAGDGPHPTSGDGPHPTSGDGPHAASGDGPHPTSGDGPHAAR